LDGAAGLDGAGSARMGAEWRAKDGIGRQRKVSPGNAGKDRMGNERKGRTT